MHNTIAVLSTAAVMTAIISFFMVYIARNNEKFSFKNIVDPTQIYSELPSSVGENKAMVNIDNSMEFTNLECLMKYVTESISSNMGTMKR